MKASVFCRGGEYPIRSPPPASNSLATPASNNRARSPSMSLSAPQQQQRATSPFSSASAQPPSSNNNNYYTANQPDPYSQPNSYNSGNMMAGRPAPKQQEIMRLTVKMRAGQDMAIDWGFRTAGGDGGPLRITSVRPESMAEDVGLQVRHSLHFLI